MSSRYLEHYLVGKAAQRPDSINGLKPGFTRALERLYDDAPEHIRPRLKINSAYRSRALQAQMQKQRLKTDGATNIPGKQVADPDKSWHVKGGAVDISQRSDVAARWLRDNAGNYGFHFPVLKEPWHMQFTPQAQREADIEDVLKAGRLTGTPEFMLKALADARQPVETPLDVKNFGALSPKEQSRALLRAQPITQQEMRFTRSIEPVGLPADHFEKPQDRELFVYPERVEQDPYIPLDDPDDFSTEYTKLPSPPARRLRDNVPSADTLDQLGRAFSVLSWKNR